VKDGAEMDDVFLKPRLIGPRFINHSIPLELLKDFAVLEEMLVEIAKWKYLQSHPERKRVHRGFVRALDLRMKGIEEGSAVPVIALEYSGLFPTENIIYFEQARDSVIDTIAAASNGQPFETHLPRQHLNYFDRFGRSLRFGERIEFVTKSGGTAMYTPEIRRLLVMESNVEEWTEETTLRGTVPEADQERMSFQLKLRDGSRLKAPIPDPHYDSIIDAFNGCRSGVRILIHGVVKKNRRSQIQSIESVEYASLLDPLDPSARLDELAELKDGWLNGQGIAPDRAKLEWLAQTFDFNYDPDLPLPHLYPTAEGGIQAEWSIAEWEITLEVHLESRTGEFQAVNMANDTMEEAVIDLSENSGWSALNTRLKAFIEGGL
jgi:hypothetical protein